MAPAHAEVGRKTMPDKRGVGTLRRAGARVFYAGRPGGYASPMRRSGPFSRVLRSGSGTPGIILPRYLAASMLIYVI